MADATPTGGPLPAAPSLAGVAQNTDDQQAQVLGAMARYGQAGLDAYNQAQNNVIAQRQSVLDSVARAQGISPDASALIASKVQASTAPALTDLQQGQANLQADLARGNDMYTRYAGEANAALPVIQAQQQTQMGIRDQALQLAQQQIDADKAAAAAKAANDQKMAALQLAQQQSQTEAARLSALKAQADAAKSSKPSASDILNTTQNVASLYGGGPVSGTVGPDGRTQSGQVSINQNRTPVTDDMMMAADDAAGINGTSANFELAKIVAQKYGLSPDEAAQLITPGSVAASTTKETKALTPPVAPDVKTAAKALGGDTGGAQAVLSGSRWPAVVQMVNTLATAPLNSDGTINSPGGGSNGLTPWQAMSAWMKTSGTPTSANLAPGDTKTPMVVEKSYKAFLDSLIAK